MHINCSLGNVPADYIINYVTIIGNTHTVVFPPIYFPRERQKINIHVTDAGEFP